MKSKKGTCGAPLGRGVTAKGARSSRPRSPQGRSGRWRRARPLLGGRCPPSPSRCPGARSARSPALCLRRGDRNAIAAKLPLSPALVVLKRGEESESFPALRVKRRRKTASPPTLPPQRVFFVCGCTDCKLSAGGRAWSALNQSAAAAARKKFPTCAILPL